MIMIIFRRVFLCLTLYLVTISTDAVAIPIYDVGDYIDDYYGLVIGISITDLLNGITVENGNLSGPSLLFSETQVLNGVVVSDLIVQYYYSDYSEIGVPEPTALLLILIGLPVLIWRKFR